MGNNQAGPLNKRERLDSSAVRGRNSSGNQTPMYGSAEDGCPVQVKIAKSDDAAVTLPDVGRMSVHDPMTEYPVVFKWFGGSGGPKAVYICGSWDSWTKKIPLARSTNDFSTIIDLQPGPHEYKFMVDGKWVVDDNQPKTSNEMGSENNVITIDEEDFEVFDALDKDLAQSNAGDAMRPNHDTPNDKELEKMHSFTQELPDKKDFEKAHNPPMLPPHLLQVILNKDTPVQCDPNVLPEPNHVMLNHLYALSIKDGVMVLSSTHRYRKKYVTTLLYKPI